MLTMLLCLRVSHFAIIDQLEVEFGPGLNVVTGETGAGKSILVSALQLVLGGKARAEVVRTGAQSAEVEALFDVSDDPCVMTRLREMGIPNLQDPAENGQALPTDGPCELVLRRVISKNGRSRAYINGRMASASQLAGLAAGLCDISSQHEHHTLVDSASHIRYLDAFAGLNESRSAMADSYRHVVACDQKVNDVQQAGRDRLEREDLLRFQVQEIQKLGLKPGEERQLQEERDRSRNCERLGQLTGGAEEALYAADEALCQRLARVIHMVQEATTMDRTLSPVGEQLEAAQVQLEDAARELGSYAGSINRDPARLADVEDRLHALSRLKRKYGDSVEAILAHGERARSELDDLDQSEARLEALDKALQEAQESAGKLANQLSRARRRAGKRLGAEITKELASLSMGDAAIRVDVLNIGGLPTPSTSSHAANSAKSDGAASRETGVGLSVQGARLTANGIDRVEFLIAPNRGEAPQPLHKVASGGELSRAMLAIKRVLAGVGPGGLYVFDEVDSGVGGAIAEVIGRKVKEVSNHHQVLCITHLPQIAAFADNHFHVRKDVQGGRTCSRIDELNKTQQQEEIARMLGGIKITKNTRAAARDMLQEAVAATTATEAVA